MFVAVTFLIAAGVYLPAIASDRGWIGVTVPSGLVLVGVLSPGRRTWRNSRRLPTWPASGGGPQLWAVSRSKAVGFSQSSWSVPAARKRVGAATHSVVAGAAGAGASASNHQAT